MADKGVKRALNAMLSMSDSSGPADKCQAFSTEIIFLGHFKVVLNKEIKTITGIMDNKKFMWEKILKYDTVKKLFLVANKQLNHLSTNG